MGYFAHQHQAYAAPSRGKKQNGQPELDWIPHRPVPCRLCEVKNCENQDQIDASGNQVSLPSQLRLPDKARSCQLAVLKIVEQLVAFSTPNARDPESCIPSAELHVCSQEQFRCLVTSDGLHGYWRFDGRLSPDGNLVTPQFSSLCGNANWPSVLNTEHLPLRNCSWSTAGLGVINLSTPDNLDAAAAFTETIPISGVSIGSSGWYRWFWLCDSFCFSCCTHGWGWCCFTWDSCRWWWWWCTSSCCLRLWHCTQVWYHHTWSSWHHSRRWRWPWRWMIRLTRPPRRWVVRLRWSPLRILLLFFLRLILGWVHSLSVLRLKIRIFSTQQDRFTLSRKPLVVLHRSPRVRDLCLSSDVRRSASRCVHSELDDIQIVFQQRH